MLQPDLAESGRCFSSEAVTRMWWKRLTSTAVTFSPATEIEGIITMPVTP